jgi:hypothetical protein
MGEKGTARLSVFTKRVINRNTASEGLAVPETIIEHLY